MWQQGANTSALLERHERKAASALWLVGGQNPAGKIGRTAPIWSHLAIQLELWSRKGWRSDLTASVQYRPENQMKWNEDRLTLIDPNLMKFHPGVYKMRWILRNESNKWKLEKVKVFSNQQDDIGPFKKCEIVAHKCISENFGPRL